MYPPAPRLAANCRGNSGLRNFSIAPFNHTAPTSILTHAMPLNLKTSSSKVRNCFILRTSDGGNCRMKKNRNLWPCVYLLYNCAAERPRTTIEEGILAEERLSRVKFIKLGAALGMGAAGASLVAACGGDEKASQGEGETPGA